MPARRAAGGSLHGRTGRAGREGQPTVGLLAARRLAVCLAQPPRWAPRPGSAIFAGAKRSSLVPAGLGRHVSSRIFGIFGRYDIISTPLFHTHLITKPFDAPRPRRLQHAGGVRLFQPPRRRHRGPPARRPPAPRHATRQTCFDTLSSVTQ